MSKKGLIYETLNDVKSMDIKRSNDGFMHLSGVFGVCGVRNNNNRVYETKNYAKMVESMQERLKKAPIPGELEHPNTMNMTLENISHRIDSISIDEKGVISGEITLLNTPKGLIAQKIVEGGLPLFISSRASGQIDQRTGNVTLEQLQTYDLVGSPGFSQAELHLNESQVCESLADNMCFISDSNASTNEAINENNENKDMTREQYEEIMEQIDDLKSQVDYLTERNDMLQDQLNEKQDIDLKQLADGIQNWIIEEYSPTLQNWIVEKYSEKVQNWITEQYSQTVQNWIVEQFAPQVQNWITEHYSQEVQNWITEEYSGELQNWLVEHFAPEIQGWIVNEYSQSLENWINEELKPELHKEISENKQNNLEVIDSILESLDNKKIAKPEYGRKAMLNEDQQNMPRYIAEMPAQAHVKYDLASQEVKESISRKAKLYDWSRPNAIENFWENVDFNATPQTKNLFEGLDDVIDDREKQLRASIRAWRNR